VTSSLSPTTPTAGSASRRVVVSGGGSGLGRAIAARFARDGETVVILGRRPDVLSDAAKTINAELDADLVSSLTADLEDPAQVEAVAAAIVADGPVDVLVNNAGGIATADDDSLAATAEHWLTDFRNNVLTTVLLTQALLPHIRRPGGRIVAMSSVAGVRGPGSYGAAKSALHAWVFGLATELGPDGITVNAVAPGFIPDTEFWEGRLRPEIVEPRVDGALVKRAGTPEEVAEAVAYLASPQSGFTTGQILQVNGGTVLGRG
jgi:3-oxoacyl-[acyl-carrier protein] reductase